VHLHDPAFQQAEIVIEAVPFQVRLVRVPAGADVLVVRHIQNTSNMGHQAGAGAVHFQPDHLPVFRAEFPQFPQRQPDLFQGLLDRHLLGKAVRPHLHPACPHIMGKHDVFLGRFHVPPQLGGIGRVVIESASQPVQLHP
jgi:hypothetical protein